MLKKTRIILVTIGIACIFLGCNSSKKIANPRNHGGGDILIFPKTTGITVPDSELNIH